MAVPLRSIISHLSRSEDTKIWHFVYNLRADLGGKLHSATHRWQRDTVRSISYLPYASHKVLKYFMSINGWHSLQYNIPFAVLNGYLKYGVLCAIWEWMKVEIGTVRPICGLQKLSEASFICIVQLRIVLKHFISNGCVSVWYNIPFASHLPYWAGTKIWYFGCNLRVGFGRKWHNETHELQTYAMRCASHLSCASKDGLETLHKQWMSLLVAYHPICHTERVPKTLAFCVQFESQCWLRWHCVSCKWQRNAARSISHLHYASKEGFETLHKQWLSLFVV